MPTARGMIPAVRGVAVRTAMVVVAMGGDGGNGYYGSGGSAYGSLTRPLDFGSGGDSNNGVGGAGGGVIRLVVDNELRIDGSVTAGGANGTGYSGGGSGGSIYLNHVGTLSGSGVIAADGGDGAGGRGGGGGGGRAALHLEASTFTGAIAARGGEGGQAGGTGTIFVKFDAEPLADLLVDNGGRSGAWTPVDFTADLDELTVLDGGRLSLTGPADLNARESSVSSSAELDLENLGRLTGDRLFITDGGPVHVPMGVNVPNVEIATGGRLDHSAGEVVTMAVAGSLVIDDGSSMTASVDLTVPGNLTIESGGSINADGKGFSKDSGGGLGGDSGGAGYGGVGGDGNYGVGGVTYGSITAPVDFGSGGDSRDGDGGAGGGYVRLHVGGGLLINGALTANGMGGTGYSGGGSGGSIYATVTAGALSGNGIIEVDGGDGAGGYGGGGGRIAMDSPDVSGFEFANVSVDGGSGYNPGQAGTVSPSTVRGTKWHDTNQDGVRDAGEPGLEGWRAYLDL